MTGARTITLTLTRGQYDALAIAASEGADSPDLAAARDALEQAWADACRRHAAGGRYLGRRGWGDLIGPDPERTPE